jgi:hypothetical protein
MATPNYQFEKRRREIEKKAKKAEKKRQKEADARAAAYSRQTESAQQA